MKFDVIVFLISAACAVTAGDHSSSGTSYEEPVQVIIQKAGPSQTFGWLGNGHDEHAHPRRPPIRPQYIFMGRPDFVLSYSGSERQSAAHGLAIQQTSGHGQQETHGHNHGGNGRQ